MTSLFELSDASAVLAMRHGLVDRSILRSRAVPLSLGMPGATAAPVRLRGGRLLDSPALVADGNHARIDACVPLGVVASAILVALGLESADRAVGLAITLAILKITWDSWQTIRRGIHAHD